MPTSTLGPDQVLNRALADFINALQSYFPVMLFYGVNLLTAVIYCGLAYALLMAILNHDWFGMFMALAFAFVRIAILWLVMDNLESLGGMFQTMATTVGYAVSRESPNVLSPSGFYDQGLNIVGLLFKARHWGSWFNLIADMEFLLLIIVTQATWFGAGCIYMWRIIECEWLIVKGTVTVCFAAFPNTFTILENWAVSVLRAGIGLLGTLLVIAVGMTLSAIWINDLNGIGFGINTNPIEYGMITLVESLIVFYAAWKLPQKAERLIISSGSGGGDSGSPGAELFGAGTGVIRAGAQAVAGGAKTAMRSI